MNYYGIQANPCLAGSSGVSPCHPSIQQVDTRRLPRRVAADLNYQYAKENTPHTARMAHDEALARVMQVLLKDDTQVYRQFVQNESFRRFVGDMVYAITSK